MLRGSRWNWLGIWCKIRAVDSHFRLVSCRHPASLAPPFYLPKVLAMTKFSRRQFQCLTLSTAAASVLTSVGRLRAVGPNDKLGIAVVGVNGRGGSHLDGFAKHPNVEIRAIVDVDIEVGEKKASSISKTTGVRPKVYRDMREAFDSKDIDIVSCAAPNHWHALCGIWAMQAGKDVYLEKPICHNINEGRALIAASKKYGRMVQTGTQTRSSQAAIDAMEYIKSGKLGEVKFARGLCYKRRKSIGPKGDYPVPADVDFNLWSGPATFTEPKVTREKFHYDWHWQRHYGNGDLGNQGPHQTDVARWGLGLNRHPNSIITYGGRLGYQAERNDAAYIDGGDTANTEVSLYDYGDKFIVFETRGLEEKPGTDEELVKLMGDKPGNKVGVVFYGTEGFLVQNSYAHFAVFDLKYNLIQEFRVKDTLNTLHMANFTDACMSRDASRLTADAETGHLSAAVSHLGNISYYLGESNRVSTAELTKALSAMKGFDKHTETLNRTLAHLKANGVDVDQPVFSLGPQLNFDPDTERFTNNEAANQWLSREYRPGFEVPNAKDV
jgi:predicted dehydrogenase